jgi:hypothetical protein
MPSPKTSKRRSYYRVFRLVNQGHGKWVANRSGIIDSKTSPQDAMEILRGLSTKNTTAVVVTQAGAIRLAARAGKKGGKDKTSAKVAKIAAGVAPRKRLNVVAAPSSPGGRPPKNTKVIYSVRVAGTGTRMLKPKASKKAAAKKTSR